MQQCRVGSRQRRFVCVCLPHGINVCMPQRCVKNFFLTETGQSIAPGSQYTFGAKDGVHAVMCCNARAQPGPSRRIDARRCAISVHRHRGYHRVSWRIQRCGSDARKAFRAARALNDETERVQIYRTEMSLFFLCRSFCLPVRN